MNPYLAVFLCAAGFTLAVAVMIIRAEHKRKKSIMRKIRRIYGQVPEREYETGDIERISTYFRGKQSEGFYIDDITWNDLDMDRVFMMVNQTISSPGEDVLYDMMRRPLFSKEKVQEREALIEFFAQETEKREKIQFLLSSVGKTKLGSLSETVLAIRNAPKVNPKIHIFMLVLLLLTLFIAVPASPLYGFFLFLVLGVANMMIYYASKDYKLIEMYRDSFVSPLRMLSAAAKMETVDWAETKKQMDAIRDGKKAFGGLRKKAVFLTGKNDGTGDFLQAILDYVRMVFHVDILAYNSILREVGDKTDKIIEMIDNMGELDAAISIASFREMLLLKCMPEFTDGQEVRLEVEDLYHPLISEPVANSISVQGGVLVTGSNASGKSTFLKNIAINAILAQTLCTCTAGAYKAPFLKVMTSMALRDDLSGGESYFIVEIKSLKRILDESKTKEPLLCIIDEVLRGTNTIERIAASSRILKELAQPHVLPFAATHDIELSYILNGIYKNYHFEEEVLENEVVFNYLLKSGRATTRNAIRLLEMLGYDKTLVEDAGRAAADFEQTGVWKMLKEQ